jgi:hypothetical protein
VRDQLRVLAALPPREKKRLRYPLDTRRRLCGLQSRSGRCGVDKNLSSLPGIQPWPSNQDPCYSANSGEKCCRLVSPGRHVSHSRSQDVGRHLAANKPPPSTIALQLRSRVTSPPTTRHSQMAQRLHHEVVQSIETLTALIAIATEPNQKHRAPCNTSISLTRAPVRIYDTSDVLMLRRHGGVEVCRPSA